MSASSEVKVNGFGSSYSRDVKFDEDEDDINVWYKSGKYVRRIERRRR